ncbi:MAG: hypothetical protein U0Z26_14080 [Anaerolineales bacterium]
MKKFLSIFFVIFLTACLPKGVQIPQSPALALLERKSGLISYIGTDGNIYIADQGASNIRQLTKDATPLEQTSGNLVVYQSPTWSFDGNQLAFIRATQDASGIKSEIYIADAEAETSNSIYSSKTEFPFYLSWSNDNQNIDALMSTATQQTMMLQRISTNGKEKQVIDTGTPYYWSLAPDSTTMLVHKNSVDSPTGSQLSFLKLGEEVTEYVADSIPASFQSPAWSPNGKFILLTNKTATEKQELVLADSTGKTQKNISTFKISTAFAWAFDSEHFAYIDSENQLANGVIGPLHVTDVNGGEEIVIKDKIIAFFWSPNSKRLAYFIPFNSTPDATNGTTQNQKSTLVLQLNILDIASGTSREVYTYQPSAQFLSILPYFDQYHQSMTIWSPDSNYLTLPFVDTDSTMKIAIVPGSGQTESRLLAEGIFSTWSWK